MAEKRKLFEEVGETTRSGQPQTGGMIDAGRRGARGAIRLWLIVLFALVVTMIAVGGLTRLTDSGLSITEWRPLTGALPPMSAEAWQVEFDKYRAIPEYQLQNKGMSLSEFQFIYWWEWGHRQLGRVIGLVWALGFFGFLLARRIPTDWTGRLLGLGVLGGLQGAIGWWMVASGLTGERLDVASYRLATHLGLAFVILGLIAWYVYALGREERALMQARRSAEPKLFSMSTGLMHFAFLQILLGALVAGIDAGRTYNDWPLMAGHFLPPYPFDLTPVWRNFFENAGLVQFLHRMAGYLLFAFGVVVWLRARRSANRDTRFRFNAIFAVLCLQMVLGIVTVLYMAPWQIAILHQLGAVALWALILRGRFAARYPVPQSLRS
ncbi:heme A synthase [Thetidibacter halocola]|uniref:Heme A synthase n=1 Tax=Thetidibacter halocola TaxID=2827239 RepID=A0A8J7W7Y3_9RHOB|nr:heme A synthase [Thetidibacter halocola]MBS0122540.1 COX15/CtaA family protein [Thetidibacter halocola]